MRDKRITYLAKQLVTFSVYLKKGEKLLIDAWDNTDDLVEAIVEAAQDIGAQPFIRLQRNRLDRKFIMGVTEEGMEAWYRFEETRMKEMDAYIALKCTDNLHEFSDVPKAQMDLYNKYNGRLQYGVRGPNTKWCNTRFPCSAMAQQAGMSSEAFEDYYFDVCCLDYKRLNEIVTPLFSRMSKGDVVQLKGPGTDITFSIKGQCKPVGDCGTWNIPCGEVGMPVVPDSANGHIAYNIPSNYLGFVFEDVSLTLKDGIIIDAKANDAVRINEILDTDANARRIGEFALGFNPYMTKPILETLFDEKMEKTLHFTPGNSPNSSINKSAIHWDLVTSHAKECGGGEVWLDGELIRKDGIFIPEDLVPINPENMIKEVAPQYG